MRSPRGLPSTREEGLDTGGSVACWLSGWAIEMGTGVQIPVLQLSSFVTLGHLPSGQQPCCKIGCSEGHCDNEMGQSAQKHLEGSFTMFPPWRQTRPKESDS